MNLNMKPNAALPYIKIANGDIGYILERHKGEKTFKAMFFFGKYKRTISVVKAADIIESLSYSDAWKQIEARNVGQ